MHSLFLTSILTIPSSFINICIQVTEQLSGQIFINASCQLMFSPTQLPSSPSNDVVTFTHWTDICKQFNFCVNTTASALHNLQNFSKTLQVLIQVLLKLGGGGKGGGGVSAIISWCFGPSQPQRITSGL